MALKGVCAPREAHAKFAWPPLLRRSLFFFTLLSCPLFCVNPFSVSTPFWLDLLLHQLPLVSTPFACVLPPFCVGNLKNGGHRLLRLETIDFVTPKVVGSKKEQILFLAPVLLSSRSISCLK